MTISSWNSSFVLFYQVLYHSSFVKPSYPFRGVAFFCLRQRKSFVSDLHLFPLFFRLKMMAIFKVLVASLCWSVMIWFVCQTRPKFTKWHHVFPLTLLNWHTAMVLVSEHTAAKFNFLSIFEFFRPKYCNLRVQKRFFFFFRVKIQIFDLASFELLPQCVESPIQDAYKGQL